MAYAPLWPVTKEAGTRSAYDEGDILSNLLDPTNLSPEDTATLLATVAAAGLMSELPASKVIVGDEIEYTESKKIGLPKDMPLRRAYEILKRVEADQETEVATERKFNYRPMDGAVACANVMRRTFGITFGERIMSFFRNDPPQLLQVPVGIDETVEVPWGRVSIPTMPGTTLFIGKGTHNEYGTVFAVNASYPKKYTKEIKKFLADIDTELKTNSIYRGKAVIGVGEQPEFMDLSTFKSAEIVFADEVEDILNGTVWSVITHRERLKEEGVKIKHAALLEGPYGCGKTSALLMTAELAVANGWTYIKVRPGENVNEALKLARLYTPAVVSIEDIDNEASTAEGGEVSKLLESFDGITSKGAEVVVVLTTNHLDRVHKGMLRPGRLDAVVRIAELDRGGVERLVKAVIPQNRLASDVDFDEVHAAMQIEVNGEKHGFFPAFVKEALDRAKRVAISKSNGDDYVLDTYALVTAAKSLHTQLRTMIDADEGQPKPIFDTVFRTAVRDEVGAALHGQYLVDGGEADYEHPDRNWQIRVDSQVKSTN